MPESSPLYSRTCTDLAVERIYETALDPDRMPQAIEAMAAATGAAGAMFGIYDPVAGGGHAPAIHGLDPALMPVYEARFQLNPWTRGVARNAEVGRHLQRAFDLMVQLDTLHSRLHATEDALDRIRCAVFVLDAQATILFANRAAHGLLAAGDGLGSAGSTLGARINGDAAALRALIARAAGGNGPRGARPQSGSLRIQRGVDRLPLAAIAVPTTPQRSPLRQQARQVLLFVADPGACKGVAAALLREAFGLTDREANVALTMLRLGGLPAAAGELNIALSTARSHLQHVFDKTGTRNQVALAQMLAALGALPEASAVTEPAVRCA